MKYPLIIFSLCFLLYACGSKNATSTEESTIPENKKTSTKAPANKNVDGFYELKIGGETFQANDLDDNYCNMTFNYSGDKSFVVSRWKGKKSENSLLLTIYGSEKDIENPGSLIENMLSASKERPAVHLSYVKGKTMEMINLGEGEVKIEEFSKGKIVGSFKGKGGSQRAILKKEDLTPYEGSFSLTTKLITESGK